jgi:hypothetical protein
VQKTKNPKLKTKTAAEVNTQSKERLTSCMGDLLWGTIIKEKDFFRN